MPDASTRIGPRRRRGRVHELVSLVALGVCSLGAAPARADVAGSISLVHPDGSGFTVVSPTVLAESLDWSPDGTRLAFENYVSGDADIFVVGADGSGLRRLTADPGDELRPRWVDDARLTFERRAGEEDTEVYQVRDDGSGTSLLLTLPGRNLDWSPDRSTVAFSSRRAGSTGIWTMRADGSGLRRVTDKVGDEDDPVWSPDGSRIAFGR
jgi:Tol biopolymer transport system component